MNSEYDWRMFRDKYKQDPVLISFGSISFFMQKSITSGICFVSEGQYLGCPVEICWPFLALTSSLYSTVVTRDPHNEYLIS